MSSLSLVTWITHDQLAALRAGEPVATADPEPARIAAFCARNRIPWATPSTALACFLGEPPAGIASRHRGLVRVTFDVQWLLEEVRVVTSGRFADLALALDAQQAAGADPWRELRQIHVLGGAPADRGEAIGGLVARYLGGTWVEARMLRAFDLDDVDAWTPETGLPLVQA